MNTRASEADMVQVRTLQRLDDLRNPVLLQRARRAHAGLSQEFIACHESEEAGLLTFDYWSRQSLGFVQEIFVLPQFRQLRIATRLLAFAESLASDLGCQCVRLKPYSLDEDTDQARLEDWYMRMGYQRSTVDQETVEKAL